MVESFRYVHHNKCAGGYAIDEVDHNTYCWGRADPYYEELVFVPECKKCPRLIYNNEDKIDEYIKQTERSRHMKAFIIGVFITVSLFDAVFMYAALICGSDEDDREELG